MILKRGITRCYDCYPRAKAKTFQVCTLRTLPEKPIHCLVWGKHLFGLMFGPPTDQNLLGDILDSLKKDSDSKEEIAKTDIVAKVDRIFTNLYSEMLEEQIKSNPEKFGYIKRISSEQIKSVVDLTNLPDDIDYEADTDKVHDISFYIKNFYITAVKLLLDKLNRGQMPEFEKDDEIHIRFTISAANLRSHCFGIPLVTEYDGKTEVGRIIPAICSSNSMVAALEIIELTKYLFKEYLFQNDRQLPQNMSLANKECYIQGAGSERIKPTIPMEPNPQCTSCNVKNIMYFKGNLDTLKIKQVIEAVQNVKTIGEFSLFCGADILFENADYLEEDEIEIYLAKANRFCRDYVAGSQIKFIFELDGQDPISVYVADCKETSEVCLQWSIDMFCPLSPMEQFIKQSNKKIRNPDSKPKPGPACIKPSKPVVLEDMEILSSSGEGIEIVVDEKKQNGHSSKVTDEKDEPINLE